MHHQQSDPDNESNYAYCPLPASQLLWRYVVAFAVVYHVALPFSPDLAAAYLVCEILIQIRPEFFQFLYPPETFLAQLLGAIQIDQLVCHRFKMSQQCHFLDDRHVAIPPLSRMILISAASVAAYAP